MEKEKKPNIKRRLLLCVLGILLLAQVFNASLSISSFEKLYINTLISNYSVVARDFQRNISSAVRFGKPLEKFYGIHSLLAEVKKNNVELNNASVFLPNGNILYSLDEKIIRDKQAEKLRIDFAREMDKTGKEAIKIILHEKTYNILLPIFDRTKNWLGTVNISFKEETVRNKIIKIIWLNLQYLALTTLIAGILLYLSFNYFIKLDKVPSRLRIYLILFLIVGVAQIAYSTFNIKIFQSNYIDIIRTKSLQLSSLVKNDIDFLLGKGIKINKLIKIDTLLSEIIQVTPEIDDMQIVNISNDLLYFANKKGVVNVKKIENFTHQEQDLTGQMAQIYAIKFPLMKQDTVEGYLKVNLSRQVIGSKIKEIILDAITVVVISFLLIVELTIFLMIFLKKQIEQLTRKKGEKIEVRSEELYGLIRPAAFIYFFGSFLASSFLPLYAGELYKTPIWGLKKDFVIGLPISSEMLFVGIAIILAGGIIDRKGWHWSFFIGVAFSTIGAFLCGIANNVIQFIVYRGISGFGYGLSWLACQGYVVEHTDSTCRAKGISNLVSGIFAGSICGGAVGGMLSERIGYAPVFFVASFIMILSLLFVLGFMGDVIIQPIFDKAKQKIGFKKLLQFIFNKNILILILFSSIPGALCFVGIMYYLTPIYLKSLDVSQSNIARALMVYGLSMIYLAPLISHFVDKSSDKKIYVTISGIFGGMALLTFYVLDGFMAAIVIIFLLSLSNSFGFASRIIFALTTKIAKDIGEGKSMGIYFALERVGQVIGPIILALAVAMSGIRNGVVVIGFIYMLITLMFIFGTITFRGKNAN
ncbi:MAG: MFS transporter [Desulfobacterales bacterium]|nr:MFS transporter [Desulfobacterales bacterium]